MSKKEQVKRLAYRVPYDVMAAMSERAKTEYRSLTSLVRKVLDTHLDPMEDDSGDVALGTMGMGTLMQINIPVELYDRLKWNAIKKEMPTKALFMQIMREALDVPQE